MYYTHALCLHEHEAAFIVTGNQMGATVQRTGEKPSENNTENPLRVRTQTKANPKSIAEGIFPLEILARRTTSLRFSNLHNAAFKRLRLK